MSTEIDLFNNNPLAKSDKFKQLKDVNKKLGGSSFPTTKRISIKGGKFRQIVNGDQVNVSKEDTMNIIVIDCAPISRMYYEGEYDPENVTTPSCWSSNTEEPDSDAKEVQASRCGDCPQNIKGSGQGNSRACRFHQRLAIVLEGDMKTVYQLQIPATSIFGEADGNRMPMQGYARYLEANDTPAIAVVTEMSFDIDSEVPKLYFRPVRILEEEEFEQAVALMDTEAVKNAIEFKVFETDKVEEKAEEKAEKKPKAKVTKIPTKTVEPDPEEEDDDESVEEPTKVKKTEEPTEKKEDLANLISKWDD